ncbi:hypothetical protein LWP59_00930 [Amycolatopsis acidiphila]|uniref:PPE domain-containing protein n=1 Tax=Amycolatopsis acidiphila TaxID=715473 RepID=A0A558AMU1_9PSEU|nr:hypothetical protein [Amycolatopsis acidiphila]TVT25551.1 hypothetical protein FNH06_01695 [Amycolatopsis acidiphila]UIJ60299.1 hypothetical protein LWP59_00930 [Amycolatopsis acidiphila]GHG60222.1 hypothetical protein GCM10017788_13770 [Amycolatopsis acidiphila]
MTNPQQQGNQGLDQYNNQYQDMTPWTHGGRYTSPEEALKQQLVAQGYDPNSKGFFDLFNNLIAQSKANATADQQRTQQSRQLSQGVEFRSGLPAPDTHYQGYDHSTLQTMVQSVNPGQVTGVSTSWTQLANAMATFGQQLGQAATKSGATWKGDAAESAYNFVSGLGTWSDQSGQAAQLASDQVYSQSSAAETAKNSMPEPIPFSWTDEMKGWASSNPLDLVDNIDKSFQKQQQSQEAHDQAVQVMTSYDNNLYTAASKAPAFNPPPTFEGPTGGTTGHLSGSIDGTSSAGYTGPSGGTGGVGGTGGTPGGGQVGGGNSGSLSGSLAGLSTPVAPTLNSGVKTGGSSTPGRTSAQGFQPPGGNSNSSTSSGLGQAGLGSMGGMPMGAMGGGFGGMGDGDDYSSKVGRGGGSGFGPGGSAASSGSGSSGSAGAGAQSGARAGGAGAAETAAGGSGARGSAGSSGRSGMGGMGHGGKGQGGEDEEHQRPSWLIEPDPDEVFGTTERTAPPVIGE